MKFIFAILPTLWFLALAAEPVKLDWLGESRSGSFAGVQLGRAVAAWRGPARHTVPPQRCEGSKRPRAELAAGLLARWIYEVDGTCGHHGWRTAPTDRSLCQWALQPSLQPLSRPPNRPTSIEIRNGARRLSHPQARLLADRIDLRGGARGGPRWQAHRRAGRSLAYARQTSSRRGFHQRNRVGGSGAFGPCCGGCEAFRPS